jgi:MFS family permease
VPRETPGVIGVLVLSALAFLGNIKVGIIAQVLTIVGLLAMGTLDPTFEVMLVFLFINSLGMHMFIPLYDSIGMSLATKAEAGKVLGRFNSIRTACTLIAGLVVFWGFNSGFFSFNSRIITPFIIAASLLIVITVLLFYLLRLTEDIKATGRPKLIFRKAYMKFYVMAFLFGGRKQIMFVFGPWVLIELLDFGADYMALLMVAGAGIGIFLLPQIGKLIDKIGTGKVLMIEAIGFLILYLGYGVISFGVVNQVFAGVVILGFAIAVNVFDRVVAHLGMVRSIYVRQIAQCDEDVTPTLAVGMSLDHIVGISSAILGGFIWHNWGPWWVFVFSSFLAVGNLLIARSISKEVENS